MYGFIYITENKVNGKKYLGMCRYNKKGWKTYLGSGKHLRLAIKKYGSENFLRTIIKECQTKEELSKAEMELILEYNCVESRDWYNIASGGYTTRGFLGKTHTQERNRIVSSKLKNRPRPQHVKDAVSKAQKGKRLSQEHKQKLIDCMTGKNHFRAVSVIIDGISYQTITEANRLTGISKHKIRKLISQPC